MQKNCGNLLCQWRGASIKNWRENSPQFLEKALSNFLSCKKSIFQHARYLGIEVPTCWTQVTWDGAIRIDTVSHDPPKTVMDRWISEYLPTTVKCSFIIKDLIRITNLAMATVPLVICSLVDSASVQNCQVTLWLLIKSGLLSGHFRWLLDNELLTAKQSI